MPIYEFECAECKIVSEVIRTIEQRYDIEFCPNCRQEMKKLVSKVGRFNFVGSGFYVNDYKERKKEK